MMNEKNRGLRYRFEGGAVVYVIQTLITLTAPLVHSTLGQLN